jgi:Na+/proline symporter
VQGIKGVGMNGMEQDDRNFLESEYKTKQILVVVNIVAFIVGLLAFSIACINGNVYGLLFLLLFWFIGGLIVIIMLGLGLKSLKKRTTFGNKIVGFIAELVGVAFSCPVSIVAGLFRMYKIKIQLAENNL